MRAPWDSAGNRSWFEQCRHGGGSESSASTSQATSNYDQRAAADTGSVSASGGGLNLGLPGLPSLSCITSLLSHC